MTLWYPHVTVATVVERDGRFLLVHEQTDQGLVYNQPAGHLEADESFIEAAVRETLEETRWQVQITHLLAISRYLAPGNGVTYVRLSFAGRPLREDASRTLDPDIQAAVWLTYEEIVARRGQLRSPLVLQDIDRYRSAVRYPLELLRDF